jgi:glycerophosphoryl diester phosphodiesterase
MNVPVIAGHRGAAGLAPENTLPSFRKAVELGVRLLELDVRLSRDEEVVCFHDPRLDRVTPAQGAVIERDWSELSELPVMPGAFGGAYPDAGIPRLEEVLAHFPDCRFLVELKTDGDLPGSLVSRTLDVVGSADAEARCRIISFDQEALEAVRSLSPDLGIGVLANARAAGTLLDRALRVGAAAIHPPFSALDEELVRRANNAGFLLNAWTVNSPEEVRRLAALGVDEITTDHPDMALSALRG